MSKPPALSATEILDLVPERCIASSLLVHVVARANLSQETASLLAKAFDPTTLQEAFKVAQTCGQAFRYQGFDPAITIQEMLRSWERKSQEAFKDEIDMGDHGGKLNLKNEFITCVTLAINFFLHRGSNVEKILKKSTPAATALLSKLCTAFGVPATANKSASKRGEALDPVIVTLPRIAASFPHITIDLFRSGQGKTLMPETLYFDKEVPRVLLAPGLAAVLPDVKPNIHYAILWVNYLNDIVLHKKEADRTKPDKILTYYIACNRNETLNAEARVKMSLHFKLGTKDDGAFKFTKQLVDLSEESLDKLVEAGFIKKDLEAL